MFHRIITLLTTTAVALHAMLGCCAHHAHSCDSHEANGVPASVKAEHRCSQGHEHHKVGGDSPTESLALARGCGHEDGGGRRHDDCEDGECSFTTAPRSNELELMLAFSWWCQSIGDAAQAGALDRLLSLHVAADTAPDPMMDSGAARAATQVWRL